MRCFAQPRGYVDHLSIVLRGLLRLATARLALLGRGLLLALLGLALGGTALLASHHNNKYDDYIVNQINFTTKF